jgi:hypothetical protein
MITDLAKTQIRTSGNPGAISFTLSQSVKRSLFLLGYCKNMVLCVNVFAVRGGRPRGLVASSFLGFTVEESLLFANGKDPSGMEYRFGNQRSRARGFPKGTVDLLRIYLLRSTILFQTGLAQNALAQKGLAQNGFAQNGPTQNHFCPKLDLLRKDLLRMYIVRINFV